MTQRSPDRDLMAAIEAGDCDGARAALLEGADVHQGNEHPIREAAWLGHAAIVGLLVAAGADHSVHDHQPLRDAEENGHTETARILRDAGSYNPFVPGEFERSIAERAARDHCAAGGTDSFENVRDRVLRSLAARRPPFRPPEP